MVASRHRRHLLRGFVQAVSDDPATTEVVVVVDGDTDGSYGLLVELQQEFPRLRPLLGDGRGQLRAMDLGVAHCTGEVVLLMDDDVLASPGLVTGHARRHRERRSQVVMGHMPVRLQDGASPATRLYAREYEAHCARLGSGDLAVLEGLWLGNVSARRSDLVAVGLASEDYTLFWHSDLDLGLRLARHGATGVFDRELGAAHLHAQADAAFLAAAHQRGEAIRMLEVRHPERFDQFCPAPVLDGLSPPVRRLVSLLGREGVALRAGRLLMRVAAVGDRLGRSGAGDASAKLARRILVVCGERCAADQERATAADELNARPARTPVGGRSA